MSSTEICLIGINIARYSERYRNIIKSTLTYNDVILPSYIESENIVIERCQMSGTPGSSMIS